MELGRWSSALVALGVAGMLSPQARADEWSRHWTVGAKPEIRIHAGDAAIIVEGQDSNTVDAKLVTRGWTIGRNGVEVIEHQIGNSLDIEVRVPPMHFSFGDRSIRLEVHAPRELIADLHTGDGSIKLSNLRGTVRVDTGDGSIQGEGLDGQFSARTGDGSVHVGGRFDDLQLHTNDGSVELNIEHGSRLRSGWRVETGDGSVRVGLPNDLAADVEFRTGDGGIRVNVPLSGESKSEHEVRGKLSGGGPSLVVKTGDGSIHIYSI